MKNIIFFPLSIESVLDVPSSSSPGLPDFLSRWAAYYEKGLEVSFSQLLGWLILLLRAISVALTKLFAAFKTIKFKANISKLPDFLSILSKEVQEVELSTIWTDETAKVESEKGKEEERRCRCAKRQKSRETPCFANVCVPGGSKSRLAKAAGAKDESSKIARRFGAKQIWKSKS